MTYYMELRRSEERGMEKGREKGREEGRKEGREEGRKEGRMEGRMEEKKEIAINLHSMNMKDTDIANVVKVSLDVVRKWLGTAPA